MMCFDGVIPSILIMFFEHTGIGRAEGRTKGLRCDIQPMRLQKKSSKLLADLQMQIQKGRTDRKKKASETHVAKFSSKRICRKVIGILCTVL